MKKKDRRRKIEKEIKKEIGTEIKGSEEIENEIGTEIKGPEEKGNEETEKEELERLIDEAFGVEYADDEDEQENFRIPKSEYEKLMRFACEKTEELSEVYDLPDESQKVLKRLFVCKLNIMNSYGSTRDIPACNMLIKTDEEARAVEMANEISEALGKIGTREFLDEVITIDEKALLSTGDLDPHRDNVVEKWKRRFENSLRFARCVIIHECADEPMVDYDAPSARDLSCEQNRVKYYKAFWDTIAEFSDIFRECTFLIIVERDVYNRSFRLNKGIVDSVCRFNTFVPEMCLDKVYKYCMLHFNNFERDKDFDDGVRKYIEAEYPRREVSRALFCSGVKTGVLESYYADHEGKGPLTAEMIPAINSEVLSVEDVLAELEKMTGLESVKNSFKEMYNDILVDGNEGGRRHMMFLGNPGTGKTTVARLVAKIFFSMGIIKTDKLVEITPSDLLSQWRGNTSKKTLGKIKEAYDGVLFVDEAYDLSTHDDECKKTALTILMKEMEDNQDRLVVIFAGYENEMEELCKTNPGFASRIRYTFKFEDYNIAELKKIFMGFVRKSGFELDPEADVLIDRIIKARKNAEDFGNGRDMENLWNDIHTKWRMDPYVSISADNAAQTPKVIGVKNLEAVMPPKDEINIDDLIGLTQVKKRIADFKSQMEYAAFIKKHGGQIPPFNMHMAFTGNPGTGKTTVAKGLGRDLFSMGVLNTNKCIETNVSDLIKCKMTDGNINKVIKKAEGGVLFIDEAYALAETNAGITIIGDLLIAMEKHKEDTIIVFAGYSDKMGELLKINPGLESRIGYIFDFENYNMDELYQIFEKKMAGSGFELGEGVKDAVLELVEYFSDTPNFGNGRFVEGVVREAINRRASRKYDDKNGLSIEKEDIPEVEEYKNIVFGGKSMYDPARQSKEALKRTAVHELGHILILLLTDQDSVPESISVRSRSRSLGRVMLSGDGNREMTDEDYKNMIATLLAGRNAENEFFGNTTAGCSSDYEQAKKIADAMITEYAMGEIGASKEEEEKEKNDILREAERRSKEMIRKYRSFIERMTDQLLERQEMSGEEMRKDFEEYLQGSNVETVF